MDGAWLLAQLDGVRRAQMLVQKCYAALESQHSNAAPDAEWERLFGNKESWLGVLAKLVAMQKTLDERQAWLQEKLQALDSVDEAAQEVHVLSEEDWQWLERAVERRKKG